MTEPITKPTKYDLEKHFKEKLRIFLMSVRPAISPTIPSERLIGIVGYREKDVMIKATKEYVVPGFRILYMGDSILLEDLIGNVKAGDVVVAGSQREDFLRVINLSVKPTKEQFINNLKLFADDFVTSDTNRKNVKKAINDELKKMVKTK